MTDWAARKSALVGKLLCHCPSVGKSPSGTTTIANTGGVRAAYVAAELAYQNHTWVLSMIKAVSLKAREAAGSVSYLELFLG